jgi:hypothetical protein
MHIVREGLTYNMELRWDGSRGFPTLDEINAVSPDTPVFVLHLYSHAMIRWAETFDGKAQETAEITRDGSSTDQECGVFRPQPAIRDGERPGRFPVKTRSSASRSFRRPNTTVGASPQLDAAAYTESGV